MAMCDYYLCDKCGQKCFYDAAIAEYTDDGGYLLSGSAVDIAALCEECAKTHKCIVVPKVLTGQDSPGELGLNIDMTDVDRLRDWARNIDDGGILLTAWASPSFLVMRLRELAGRVEQEVRDVGQLRKLLGYHGNPSVSEASGSAQSEAQESSSQTTITSSSLEPETDQGAGMTVAQARDVLLGDIRYCIAAVRGNSSAPVGDCSSFVDLLIEAVRAEVPREASSREGEQQTDQGAGWLPIESAPKDGTEILCYWPNYSYEIPREFESGHQVIAIARWTINHRLDGVSESADATERRMSGAYFHDTNECDDYGLALPEHAPTHWMPLPSPPSSGKIAERSSADNT